MHRLQRVGIESQREQDRRCDLRGLSTGLVTVLVLESTLVVISAKHGQSPIDSARYLGISTQSNDPITTSPATILQALLPLSESPANANAGSVPPKTTFR